MRKIIAIAWNDIQNEFSERSTLIFFLVLPLVFTMIIGAALKNTYNDAPEDSRLPLIVVNQDQGNYSNSFLNVLNTSDVIRIVQLSEQEAKEQLSEGYPAALIIPSNFSNTLGAGNQATIKLIKPGQSNSAMGIDQAIQASLDLVNAADKIAQQSLETAIQIRAFDHPDEQEEYFNAALAAAQNALVDPPTRAQTTYARAATPQIATGNNQSSPGQLVTWVLITLLGGSEIFVDERIKGTLRRILSTPTSRSTIIGGKIIGRLSMGILQMIILVGFGALVLGVHWGNSLSALTLMLLSFGLAGTALGVMLGAFSRTRKQASGLTTLFSMLLAALGGAWWPLEVTPKAYQAVVQILPSTWAMRGFNDVIIRGQGLAGILPEAGILLAFASVFFIIGIWRLKFE